MNNERIRKASREARVPLWEVAQYLQISESGMTRLLRRPLSTEEESKILKIIEILKHDRKAASLILK